MSAENLDWTRTGENQPPVSYADSQQGATYDVSAYQGILVKDRATGRELSQTFQWIPELDLNLITTQPADGADAKTLPPVNVIDWAFTLRDMYDGARYQPMSRSQDTWWGSDFWTGPDWTRVGKDWQHPGEKTSSIRKFTVPRDGKVTVTGNVHKNDINGGDGVIASIRLNSSTAWSKEIDAADDKGFDPEVTLDVHKGDRIRFVIHRRGVIACDTTYWDPVVTFEDGTAFRASDSFGPEVKNGWAYEIEADEETGAGLNNPCLYSFDRHFLLHSQSLAPGGQVVLDSEKDLPLFILTDSRDSRGVCGAMLGASPWTFQADLNDRGRISTRVQSKGGAIPRLVAGLYQGEWRQAVSALEKLRSSEDARLNLVEFKANIESAFKEILGAVDPQSRPELYMWAEIQSDWRKQDALDETQQGYDNAIAKLRDKTKLLATDLGLSLPGGLTEQTTPNEDPCIQLFRAHAQRRALALSNPLMGFGKLLFCKRVPTSYSHLVMQYYGWRARAGGGLFILDNPGRSFAARDIFDGALEKGNTLEPRISYDAQKVVFSYVDSAGKKYKPETLDNNSDEAFYHLWEANIDGAGLHQITQGPYEDLTPTYLPDGGIVFTSSRRGGYARCFGAQFSPRWHVYTLHRVEPDGSNLRQLSFHDTNEWFPMVSNSGTILYSRWDYIDRDAVTHQTLWGTRPDGTNPMAIWGNATPKPHCTFQIHPIPGSQKIAFTASAHHSITAGPIVVLDPTISNNGQEALTRITPEIPFPEAESMKITEYYDAPQPLSEKYFLVGYSPWPLVWEPGSNRVNALGVYLVDSFGNRELIYRDPNIGSSNPTPIHPRQTPPVIPSELPEQAPDQGEAIIADVYKGLGDIPRDTIKSIRVVQIFPKSTVVAGTPPIGLAGEENARAILGEVTVEADGSARFTVPARKPVLFQLLDANGEAYQTMRSVTYLQPGEKVSCVGCHESQKNVPSNAPPAATRRAASTIVPGPRDNEPFSFTRTVQPVLDQYCARCHRGSEPAAKKDLTGEPLKGFSRSYWSLCGDKDFGGEKTNPETAAEALVPRFGMRNQIQVTHPGGAYGAKGSKLMKMLRAGHHDVNIAPEDLRRIAEWIDNNAIFFGAYSPDDQARQLRGESLPMPALQ
jgi:hypothetical protein